MRQISFLDVSDPLFQAKFFQQVASNGLCWEWQGSKSLSGYGIVSVNGEQVRAHRVSFVMAYGSIAGDKLACHTCDNPLCVNPLHLYEGTDKDNAIDCVIRGRRVAGGKGRKLSADQVADIRQMYNDKTATSETLAKRYQVGKSIIRRIVSGKTYKEAPGPIVQPKPRTASRSVSA